MNWIGPLGIFHQPLQSARIPQKQRPALVARESPGKANRQRFGIQHLIGRRDIIKRRPARAS